MRDNNRNTDSNHSSRNNGITTMTPPLDVVAAVVAMQPRPQKVLADAIRMDPANFSAALGGRKPFPPERLRDLLVQVGIADGERLDPEKVHLWIIGLSLEHLRVATSFLFPDGAAFGGVWREGAGPYHLTRVFDQPMIAITDRRARVVVVSKIGMFGTPEPVNSTTVPALRQRLGTPIGSATMLSIPARDVKRWEQGAISVAEFDAVVGQPLSSPPVTTRKRKPVR